MAREIELKLATDPDTLNLLAALNLPADWQAGPWATQQLDNRYFDTDDHELSERGLSLRIRACNGRYTQTIKTASSSAGALAIRNEWNMQIDGPELDITSLPETEWTPWLTTLWRNQQLRTLFNTAFVRRKRELRHVSGTVIELALDAGTVSGGDDSSELCEVELELLSGEAGPLFALARYLAEHHPLHPDGRSKAERGYRLIGAHTPLTERLQPRAIADDASAWQVLRDTLAMAWRHWQRYEAEFLHASNVHSAEQLRRALSLLRHAFVCYHGLPLPASMRSWPRQLTHMLRALDWVEDALEMLAADQIVQRLEAEIYLSCQEELAELLPDEREFAFGIAGTEQLLQSRQYCLFALEISAFLLNPPATADGLQTDAKELATPLVIRQWEALQTHWQAGPQQPDIDFYRRQLRLLQRAVRSGLMFGGLFDKHQQTLLINPCRDLIAGIHDANVLEQLATVARGLNESDYRAFAGWLVAQRETLWAAMTMTREHALRAEPEDL